MKSPFEKKFCGKSPLKELTAKQEANLPESLKTAIEAKSPNNYGSPLNQSLDFGKVKPSVMDERSEANQYFDSITKLPGMKEDYAGHVKRKTEGYTDPEDGYIAPQPGKILSPQRHAVSVEIGKGGKSGVAGLKAIGSDEYKKDYKGFVKSPLNQKKELPKTVKDSLQNKAKKIGKGFYSKKYKVYVDGEDGVLGQKPVKPENYEKL
jgi:hypothetical protein